MPGRYGRQERHGGKRPATFDAMLKQMGFEVDEAASAGLGKFKRYRLGDVMVTTMSGKKATLAGPPDKVKNSPLCADWATIEAKLKDLKAEKKLVKPAPPVEDEDVPTVKDPETTEE
jgi:hypothetical protein